MANTKFLTLLLVFLGFCIYFEFYGGNPSTSNLKKQISMMFITENSKEEPPNDSFIKFQNGWTAEENPNFLKYIKKHVIIEPKVGPRVEHANNSILKQNRHYSQIGQSQKIDKLLNGRRNGFFIECGAGDGRSFSNSLFFELNRNWTGLLVEPNPAQFSRLLSLGRNAYLANVCLSTKKQSEKVKFRMMLGLSGIEEHLRKETINFAKTVSHVYTDNVTDAQCFTLYSLLLAINKTTVDYFSLDIEGPELEVLRTIPFEKVQINVFTIEYAIMHNRGKSVQKLQQIRDFFKDLGTYSEVMVIGHQDVVFRRNI